MERADSLFVPANRGRHVISSRRPLASPLKSTTLDLTGAFPISVTSTSLIKQASLKRVRAKSTGSDIERNASLLASQPSTSHIAKPTPDPSIIRTAGQLVNKKDTRKQIFLSKPLAHRH